MSWQPRERIDGAEADRQARKPRCGCNGHCLDCMGRERYVAVTNRIRADLDAGRWPEDLKPRGRV